MFLLMQEMFKKINRCAAFIKRCYFVSYLRIVYIWHIFCSNRYIKRDKLPILQYNEKKRNR